MIRRLAAGELLEPRLHGGELGLQVGDLVLAGLGARGASFGLLRLRRALAFAGLVRAERAEHAERALEGVEVLAHLLLHRLEGRRAEGMGKSPPVLLLLAGERIETEFEIARHQLLHAVAVEADELAQETDGKEVGAAALL